MVCATPGTAYAELGRSQLPCAPHRHAQAVIFHNYVLKGFYRLLRNMTVGYQGVFTRLS